jgi:anti-sigma factor RsiW
VSIQMHNCKLIRSSFIDLALDELSPAKSTQLLAELDDCPACREDYAALRSTMHVSRQALQVALPGEEFWTGYHARLRSRVMARPAPDNEKGIEYSSSFARPVRMPLSRQFWLASRGIANASVRVPVPVALVLIVLFGLSFFFLRPRGQVNSTQSTPLASVETRTVQVPVIQERVVNRVVYVEKRGRKSRRGTSQWERTPTSTVANNVARAESETSTRTALSLVGFKPSDQVKLTIIKGSFKGEK